MKRISLTIMAGVFAFGAMFSSCKKDEPLHIDTNANTIIKSIPASGFTGVTKSEKGFLVFKTREDYDNFLEVMKELPDTEYDRWESQLKFTSLRSYRRNKTALAKGTTDDDYNENFDDDLFLTIIDQYGVVQIGDIIFKAETDIDLVWTLGANHLEDYGDLLGRHFEETTMNIFAISEDEERSVEAWDLVLAGTVGVNEANKGTGVFGDEDKKNDDHNSTEAVGDNKMYRADAKSCYQKAMFYFSLMTELKYMRRTQNTSGFFAGFTTYVATNWPSYCAYQSKKSGSSWQYPTHPHKLPSFGQMPPLTYWNYCQQFTWRPYASGKGLKFYNMQSDYKYYGYDNIPQPVRTVHVGIRNY